MAAFKRYSNKIVEGFPVHPYKKNGKPINEKDYHNFLGFPPKDLLI